MVTTYLSKSRFGLDWSCLGVKVRPFAGLCQVYARVVESLTPLRPGKPVCRSSWDNIPVCTEHFPSYAPELNPDEGVWALAKQELANSCPLDVDDLMDDVVRSINDIRTSRAKLRGCIVQSKLPLFWRKTIALFMHHSNRQDS
jgi:hypothetical protein